MNEPPHTPAHNFEDQLNALAEAMSNGLGRQAAIDRLVEMGLGDDEADDQEAAIREQLRAIHHGARAIYRDLDHGLERHQAVIRFQELGLSREDALQAIDSFRERKVTAQAEARKILEEVNGGLPRAEAVARFRELGLNDPTAEHLVGLRCDASAHWFTEFLWLGGLSAALGAFLLVAALRWPGQPLISYLLPAALVGYGAFFGLRGWRKRRQYEDRNARVAAAPSPFEVVRRGFGQAQAIARAVEQGVPGAEATALVQLTAKGMVRIYRWFLILGAATLAWGLYQMWITDSGEPLSRCLGAVALILWGGVGAVRGLLGWRRFSAF